MTDQQNEQGIEKRICSIYRSAKQEGIYLFVDKTEDTQRVPQELLKRLGKIELAMTILIHNQRSLALADPQKVLQSIVEQGYYLQLPPRPDQSMAAIRSKNSKLAYLGAG